MAKRNPAWGLGPMVEAGPASVLWRGDVPDACDVCGKALHGNHFIDGRTRQGPWAIMDLNCARVHGTGLGLGKGQMFQRQEDGSWKKVDG